MKQYGKRLLSLLLAFALSVSMAGTVWAIDPEDGGDSGGFSNALEPGEETAPEEETMEEKETPDEEPPEEEALPEEEAPEENVPEEEETQAEVWNAIADRMEDGAESASRSISAENGASWGSRFIFDIKLTGDTSEGTVYVAVYDGNGQMKDLHAFEPENTIAVTLDNVVNTDTAQVIWADDRDVPLCGAKSLVLRDTRSYVKDFDESHIVKGTLEYNGAVETTEYIDNEILLDAKDGVTYGQIEELVSAYQGTIVGLIDMIGHYQIELAEAPSTSRLNAIIAELQRSPLLDDAYPNTIAEMSTDVSTVPYYPSDYWGGDAWNEGYPDGRNWGVEAINAPSAWQALVQEYGSLLKFPAVTIGVVDSVFDMTHSDLKFKACWERFRVGSLINENTKKDAANAKDKKEYDKYYAHGSHVAGIVAATANASGITGVAGNQPLYGVSLADGAGKVRATVSMLKLGITKLMQANSSKRTVINYSIEDNLNGSMNSAILTKFFKDCLKKGNDFVLVTAAGNNSNIDAAENSGFNAITDSAIKSRIIVVGAVGKYNPNGTFPFIKESGGKNMNYGERIDVAAPGEDIYSTVPNVPKFSQSSDPGYDGDYMIMTGTSMAAPHVAGVAALVWAANPNLTGAEVKTIIKETADELYEMKNGELVPSKDAGGVSHSMVNAAHAVFKALDQEYAPQGRCGQSLDWIFDQDTGTLTISGTGAMPDYDGPQEIPWHRYKNQIKTVRIEDGVTSIGSNAFSEFSSLEEVIISSPVKKIGATAFLYCKRLSTVSALPECLSEIGLGAFYGTALTELHFTGEAPETVTSATSPDPSFAYGEDGDTNGIVLYYPAKYRNSWDPDGVGKWKGYTVRDDHAYYEQYRKIVEQREAQWGMGTATNNSYLQGVAVVRLLDMNYDGIDELIIGYIRLNDYQFGAVADSRAEVWTYNGEKAVNLFNEKYPVHGSDISVWMTLAQIDGEWLIISGYRGDELNYTYWGIRNGELSAVHSLSSTWANNYTRIIYRLDGTVVSKDVFDTTLDRWSMREETCPFNFASASEAKDILAKTTEAREQLGLTTLAWDEAYQKFIMEGGYLKSGQTYYTTANDFPIRFGLHDMDSDGIPELIVSNGCGYMAAETSYVYTYADSRVVYKGDAGFRFGDLIYAPDSGYPGLFCQSGNMGDFPGIYYYIQDGQFYQENVLTNVIIGDKQSEYRETSDDHLYELFAGIYSKGPIEKGLNILQRFTVAEIRSKGWDSFIENWE